MDTPSSSSKYHIQRHISLDSIIYMFSLVGTRRINLFMYSVCLCVCVCGHITYHIHTHTQILGIKSSTRLNIMSCVYLYLTFCLIWFFDCRAWPDSLSKYICPISVSVFFTVVASSSSWRRRINFKKSIYLCVCMFAARFFIIIMNY